MAVTIDKGAKYKVLDVIVSALQRSHTTLDGLLRR